MRRLLWLGCAMVFLGSGITRAQEQIRPRFMIAFDTSGSMAVDLDGIPTFGDGIAGPTEGIDTDCDGQANDSRIFVAKEALQNMIRAFGDIEFGLTAFPQYPATNILCSDPPSDGLPHATGHRINDIECNIASGPFVGGIGDPTLNSGDVLTLANCGGEWDGDPATELPTDGIPAACRPGAGANPPARLWAAGSPAFCTNYLSGCPGQNNGLYTYPNGDVLVGFTNHGWPNTMDNRVGMLRWIDNEETAFSTANTAGNICDHAAGNDCELRPNGPTPLGGTLVAARDYMTPIRAADSAGACRPYTVLLITDGVETCGGDPVATAADLAAAGIPVYVVGLAVNPGGRGLLNAIATAGGTDAGAPGGDTAFFADDAVTLSAGLSAIVADSLLVETCNGADDDCDIAIDEGFVKFCNRPAGTTDLDLCADPGETLCDGIDDNCNGMVDEGLLNACGLCGPVPTEICDGLDNNCNGVIDEGGVCMMCRPEAEICDGRDNDCDGDIDENLTRSCGVDLGECSAGEQTCAVGVWGACSDTGPSPELCNNLDDDCDGLVDNLTERCGSDVGECASGLRRCTAGVFGACDGEIGPGTEACNGLDDDCDGTIDEDVPGLGMPCGSDEGECSPGTTACIGGAIVCGGGVEPTEEMCNGLDDDCDGLVDDGIFVGTPCGSDTGECSPGFNRCVDGMVQCIDSVGPGAEACDGLDNDCDGSVDEGLGVGEACGGSEGLCMPGMLQCVDGEQTCIGEVPPAVETCDCEDNDCDGSVDEDSGTGLCPGESACVDCQCALQCQASEFGFTCPTGRAPREIDGTCFCVRERCQADACAEETIERDGNVLCAPDENGITHCVCRNNECTFACDGVVCSGEGTVCDPNDSRGRCVEDSCRGLGCPEGQVCDFGTGECGVDPCADAECDEGQACRDGVCEASCADVDCSDGQRCRGGVCEDDPCAAVSCGSQVCDDETGECVDDACAGIMCPFGQLCDPVSGDCEADPCTGLQCPDGQRCEAGECLQTSTPSTPDAGVPAPAEERVLATGSGGFACAASGAPTSPAPAFPVATLLVILGALGLRRRSLRSRLLGSRIIVAALGLGAVVLLGGCDVDSFCLNCEEPRGDATVAMDAGRSDAGIDAATSPEDAGPEDAGIDAGCEAGALERCNGLDDDCDGMVDEDVDVSSDPNNCGACGRACSPAGAFGVCEEGECSLGDCDVGFLNLDGDEGNGCEYRCLVSAADDTLCDLRDNDCDGAVDEDVDLQTDVANCGACGRACRLARASAECVAGVCTLDACAENFHDIDGEPGNGCEYACIPADPPVEGCNARDDDCDGRVDEGNPEGGAACGDTEGACAAGTQMCMSGELRCIGATGPGAESCNGIDDDCDGSTDETTDLERDPNNCGGCGVVCSFPNARSRCTASACVQVACNAGFVDLDPAAPGCEYLCDPRGGEVCNGVDDDCDGNIDEGLVPPANFCNANGVCAGTAPTCTGVTGWECNYTNPAYQDVEASCDTLDNDCDGRTDEAFPTLGDGCTNGVGACARSGSIVCTGDGLGVECSAGSAGVGMAESCNGSDDDCDGLVDEDISPGSMPTVLLAGRSVRMFAFEASRPDATSAAVGVVGTAACSAPNTLPWTTVNHGDAAAACCALNAGNACPADGTGWRLCDAADWQAACEGPSGSCDWSYSASCGSSQPTRCNGAEYDCDPAAGDQDCVFPTGSSTFSGCFTSWGGAGDIYDLSGNVKEWTATEAAPGVFQIRGGASNNLESGRSCDFDFTVGTTDFAFPNTGFRCCFYE